MSKFRKDPGVRLCSAVALFYLSAFLLLYLKDFNTMGLILAGAVPAMIWLGTILLPHLFPSDRLLLSLTNFLCALGVLVLYATNPAYARDQAVSYGVGLVAMIVCVWAVRLIRSWRGLAPLLAAACLGLLALPLAFGTETNGALNWISVGGFSMQPSEFVKLGLVIVLSWYMSRHSFLPWVVFSVCCLGLLMLQKDLGTALIYYGTALLLYFASSGSWTVTGLGVLGGAGAAVAGYVMFAHVKKRVAIWLNPWSDYRNAGYQVVQGLIALASGGVWGCGLGLGNPTRIPVYETDFIFTVICEQFGLIFGLCVLAMYVALIWRGATTAMAARYSFHGLLAMGCTLIIGLQTFTIIGGVIKLIPLTGVTLPFVSRGGSSLVTSMCLMGFVQGVYSLNADHLKEDMALAEGDAV